MKSSPLYKGMKASSFLLRLTFSGLAVWAPVADMVYIPAGTFMMGSPASEAERDYDETQHQVTLTRGFWIGKYEVTQREYVEVMGINPSSFRNGTTPLYGGNGGVVTNELRYPVENLTWHDATNYCGRLTQRELGAGRISAEWGYRLPTEAEWEYGWCWPQANEGQERGEGQIRMRRAASEG